MKKFLFALLAVIICAASCEAAKPVRIARLPIIFQSNAPDNDTCAELEMKIARAVHIPLNGTLQLVEYIPTADSTQALDKLWKKMRSDYSRAKIQDAMKPLAIQLNADIIVCPILRRYSENTAISSAIAAETYIDSNVRVELIIYDRRTDELIDKKTSEMYHDTYHPAGTAAYLAKICFDKVIDDSKIRQRIMAIRF